MTWQDFTGADTAQWIAVLPLAATEQHGPHLPLGVDRFIAEAYLARAAALVPDDLPVTFLPVQAIGQSVEHLQYPGTLSLSAETVIRAWTEIGESVRRAGVRKLLMITSHGGNVAAMDIVARELRVRHEMLVLTCGWHRFGSPDGMFTRDEIRHGIHAGDIETSILQSARPETVRADKIENFVPASLAMAQEFRWLGAFRPVGFGWMTQDLNASGGVGDASLATAEKGAAVLDHGARGFIELLREIDRFDLARLKQGPLGP
jgi:creatinine amidohydrolase